MIVSFQSKCANYDIIMQNNICDFSFYELMMITELLLG